MHLTVGHGLSILGQKFRKANPTIPLPIPALVVNHGEDGIEMDEQDGVGLPEKPDGIDDYNGSMDQDPEDVVYDKDDIVGLALVKISARLMSFTPPRI